MLMDGQSVALNDGLMADLIAYNLSNGDMDLFNSYVDYFYDSSDDYWKITKDADGKWFWGYDGSDDYDITELLKDNDFFKNKNAEQNIYKSILLSRLSDSTDDGKAFGVISADRMTSGLAFTLAASIGPLTPDIGRNLGALSEYTPPELRLSSAGNSLYYDTLDKIALTFGSNNSIANTMLPGFYTPQSLLESWLGKEPGEQLTSRETVLQSAIGLGEVALGGLLIKYAPGFLKSAGLPMMGDGFNLFLFGLNGVKENPRAISNFFSRNFLFKGLERLY
jgi:hypothetical protein